MSNNSKANTKAAKRHRHHDYAKEAQSIIYGSPRPVLCTADAAALVLGVTGKHVRELLKSGQIKGCQLGRAWRVNVSDLLRVAGIA